MTNKFIVKDDHFKMVSQVTLDSKKRATLSKAGVEGKIYQVYQNDAGQIMLDPMVLVPESEMWLIRNPKAFRAVQAGLKQSAEGKVTGRESMAKYVNDEID